MCVLPEITRKGTTENTGIYLKQVVMFVLGIFAIALCWLNLLAATGTSAFSYFQF